MKGWLIAIGVFTFTVKYFITFVLSKVIMFALVLSTVQNKFLPPFPSAKVGV